MSKPADNPSACHIAPEDQNTLSWTVHLSREYPGRFALSIALLLLAAAAGLWAIGPLGSIAAAMVMLGSLAEFLFPVHYKITSEGAISRSLLKSTEIKWERVRKCYLDEFGVKLSPLEKQTRLEAFRGVYLRFAGNADQVIAAVKARRANQC